MQDSAGKGLRTGCNRGRVAREGLNIECKRYRGCRIMQERY